MKTSSIKQKGRLGQQEVVKILLELLPEFTEDDIKSTPMGSPGEDILLSSAARQAIPWNIEVKRGKAFNLVKACKQAEDRVKTFDCYNKDCKDGLDEENFDQTCDTCNGNGFVYMEPVAMGRYDRDKKWYATVELRYLLQLLLRR